MEKNVIHGTKQYTNFYDILNRFKKYDPCVLVGANTNNLNNILNCYTTKKDNSEDFFTQIF